MKYVIPKSLKVGHSLSQCFKPQAGWRQEKNLPRVRGWAAYDLSIYRGSTTQKTNSWEAKKQGLNLAEGQAPKGNKLIFQPQCFS